MLVFPKVEQYAWSADTPSCILAPAASLNVTIGHPASIAFSKQFMILSRPASPIDPPIIVTSLAYANTGLPYTLPYPHSMPSLPRSFWLRPKSAHLFLVHGFSSEYVSGSKKPSILSSAVSLPFLCIFSTLTGSFFILSASLFSLNVSYISLII